MDKSNLKLFSDDLPVRLPIWHSVQSSNKKFSRMRHQFDFDTMPDYGGHMLNYDKKNDEFHQIKHDTLGKSPFQIKSYLTPYLISLESTSSLSNDESTHYECLRIDKNILITSLSNHPYQKGLMVKMLDNDDIEDKNQLIRIYLDYDNGNVEVNKFFNVKAKLMTHIRQKRCLTVFEFNKSKIVNNDQIIKTNEIQLKHDNEIFFSSDQNPLISEFIIAGIQTDKNVVKLTELDIDTNQQSWSTYHPLTSTNSPLQIKCSEFHPKIFYYSTSNEIILFDTRYRSIGEIKIDRNKLKGLTSIENFKQISNSITNPNYLFIASNHNLMLFDIRYPNYVLLQWSHMLSSDSQVSFIRNLKLEKETVFVATREEISCISIDEPVNKNLIHPTSLHFPLHLPKLKNLIKDSKLSDIHLDNHINQSKIVGFDLTMINDQDFNLFLMNQYDDIFKQKLTKTKLDNPNEIVLQYESSAKNMLNQNLEIFKNELLDKKKEEAKLRNSNLLNEPKDARYFSKFADNLLLDEDDKIKQTNPPLIEMDTNSLVTKIKSNLKVSDSNESKIQFIDQLQKVFKSETEELVSNDVNQFKWNNFSMKLFERWNIDQDCQNKQESQEFTQASQKMSQDYILSQYI